MLNQVLRQCFWDVYDHLGRLLVINVLLFLVALPVVIYGVGLLGAMAEASSPQGLVLTSCVLVFLTIAVGGTLLFAGVLHFAQLSSLEKDPPIRAFFAGWREVGAPMLGLMTACGAMVALLIVNLWFFFFGDYLPPQFALLAYVLGGLQLWLIFLLLAAVQHAAVLVARRKAGPLQALKIGFLLSLKYPRLTFGLLIFTLSLLLIFAAISVALFLLYGLVAPVMLMNSLHDVIVDMEQRVERRRQTDQSAPSSWKEIRAMEDETEEERLRRARYERGLGDLLRPWQM